jgi:hypothetical protein
MALKRKQFPEASPELSLEGISSFKHLKTANVNPITSPSKYAARLKENQDTRNTVRRYLFERNAVESPLLRLPREIRDEIWRLLYGDRVIHPYWWGRSHPMVFSVCQEPHTPSSIYSFALQGAVEDEPYVWKAPELNDMNVFCPWDSQKCHLAYNPNIPKPKFLVPLVCRQMWEEVSDIVSKTCIWSFTSPDDWKCFLGTKKNGLEVVRRVSLRIDFGEQTGGKDWATALDPFLMKRLPNLQGVNLWLERTRTTKGLFFGLNKLRLDPGTALLENKQPEYSQLRAIVKGLKSGQGKGKSQERKFRDDWTTVIMHDYHSQAADKMYYNYFQDRLLAKVEWMRIEERLRLGRMVKAELVGE